MEIIPAHPITTFVILGTFCLVPLLVFYTYYYSGASKRKALAIALGVIAWQLTMFYLCRYGQSTFTGPLTVPLILVANLIWPSALVAIFKDFFVGEGLSLTWLTGLQIFRNIGGLFLLENLRGFVGTSFAFAAGLGDIVVGVTALTLFIQLMSGGKPNQAVFYFLIVIGVVDFLSAFTFGFLSSEGIPFQLFAFTETHLVNLYPLGIIPFCLVPLAMAYHWLMFFTLRKQNV